MISSTSHFSFFRLALKIENAFLRFRQATGWFKGRLRYAVLDDYDKAEELFKCGKADVVVVTSKTGRGYMLIGRAQYTAVYRILVGIVPMKFGTGTYTCHEYSKFEGALGDLLLFARHYNLIKVE
jgi:hypothetical protein